MSDTKKIFVITAGSYSDYHIVGVFSTREHAEAWWRHVETEDGAKPMPAEPDWTVEEYDLDVPVPPFPSAWVVKIGDDGDLFKMWLPGGTLYDWQVKWHPEKLDERHAPYWTSSHQPTDPPEIDDNPYRGGRAFIGYGQTVEHARRSAEELRRQTLALEGKVVR